MANRLYVVEIESARGQYVRCECRAADLYSAGCIMALSLYSQGGFSPVIRNTRIYHETKTELLMHIQIMCDDVSTWVRVSVRQKYVKKGKRHATI